MDRAVIFRELPATFPEKDKYQKPSILGSVVFHVVLITLVLLIPFLTVQKIDRMELLATLVSPLGPPPSPPTPPIEAPPPAQPPTAKAPVPAPSEEVLIMPTIVPKEIARIVDAPIAPPSGGVIGGVPGGMPGGIPGGVLGSLLASHARREPPVVLPSPPPPPPPPAPSEPYRVGGMVREPRVLKLVQPAYPLLASKARVQGTVVLEAVLTAEGTVDQIRVISGHPLLIEAAIEAVKQWLYEPTYLNGAPVPVILTAKVVFQRRPLS